MTSREGKRASALTRTVCTLAFGSCALVLAVIALGAGSPVGLLLAVPPLYLMWVMLLDLGKLIRLRFQDSDSYAARPYYWLWMAFCVLPVIAWVVWVAGRLR